MQRDLSLKTAFYQARHKRYKTWQKIVMVLASVVVFCTTYALILPAITMEQEVVCGLDEHLHIETCYKVPDAVEQVTLVCKEENLNLHVHSENCCNEFGEIICGYADFVLHSHSDSCFDQAGHLVCPLEEIEAHLHDNNCYEQPHSHGEACYTPKQGALLCVMSDIDPHTHTEDCFVPVQKLNCDLPETEGHSHTDACYPRSETLICGQDAVEAHAHAEDCLDENGFVVCGLEVTEGHDHVETCYALAAEPSCGMEVTEGHTHAEGCYQTENEKVCPMEEGQIHVHEDACYEWLPQLTCEIPLPAEDAEPILICEESQRMIHTHDAACYDAGGLLACGMMQLTEHIHGDTCFIIQQVQPEGLVLSCGLDEHTHTETCYPVQDAPENGLMPDDSQLDIRNCGVAAHSHLESCYAEDGALMCTMTEHAHWELCDLAPADTTAVESEEAWYADVPTLTDDMAADLIAVAESQIGYEQSDINYIVTEDEEILYYSRYADWWSYGEKPYGDWNAKFVAFCLDTAGIPSSIVPVEPETAVWPNALYHYDLWRENDGEFAPIAADLVFFDTDNDGEADRAGIITVVNEAEGTFDAVLERRGMVQQVTYDLDDSDIMGYARIPGNEPAQELVDNSAVEHVIYLIDHMPSADEIDAQLTAFDEIEDYDGMEEWYTHAVQQVAGAYYHYAELSEEEKALVTNADKLLELEYIWSAATLAVTDTIPVYMINVYDGSHHANETVFNTGTALFSGGSPASYSAGFSFNYWTAIVVEQKHDGSLYVARIIKDNSSKANIGPTTAGGFVLFIWEGTMVPSAIDVSVGDAVAVSFDRTTTSAYTGNIYGTVAFSDQKSIVEIRSDEPVVDDYTSTRDFVELNLYDYNYRINQWWSNDHKYPGFQWNGGAYAKADYKESDSSADLGILDNVTDRNYVDSIDFGNSMISNFSYGSGQSGDYSKASGSTSVGRLYNHSDAKNNLTGKINWLWYDGDDYSTTTNRPVGFSTGYEALNRNLVNGYPALLDGTSLSYLFGDESADTYNAVDKKNSASIDGLFLQNPVTGAYAYNSRDNHAQYCNNFFTRYKQIITPNFILYPFGNFLPLNEIDNSVDATQVGAFNQSGGMKNYVDGILDSLNQALNDGSSYADDSRAQLMVMLQEYQENWTLYPRSINGTANNWSNLSAANAIRDFFWKDTDGDGDGPTGATDFITQDYLDKMYNIDWDVATNFFFGMEMKMNFMMPKDGLTGNDNGDNTQPWGTINGSPARTGDPDGIPDYPMIFNFTGDDDVWVYIDGVLFMDLTGIHRHVGGRINFQDGTVTYYELLPATTGDVSESAYATYTFSELLTAAGKSTDVLNDKGTFKDYTTHSFNFYYMERGSGSSVCRLNFNFPLLRKNSITVTKQNIPDNVDISTVGNPDYYFNIIQKDEKDLFIKPGTNYKILDSTGKQIGTGTVDNYGIFTLKSGQSAVFEGIDENKGEYYVQELIKEQDNALYDGQVNINGQGVLGSGVVNWNKRSWFDTLGDSSSVNEIGPYGCRWHFYSGYYANASTNSTFYVEAQNGVMTDKLGSLSITKQVSEYSSTFAENTYKFFVLLDGKLLPVDTEYTVGAETRKVIETGIVEIAAGETAIISNILSGTEFFIEEDSNSAKGFVVDYSCDDEEAVDNGDSISGIIRVNTNVAVTVINAETGAPVKIPVTKTLAKSDQKPHTYTFKVERVEATFDPNTITNVEDVPLESGGSVTITDAPATTELAFNIKKVDILSADDFPAKFYYRITEEAATDSLVNSQIYLAEVTVSDNPDSTDPTQCVSEVTNVWVVTTEGEALTFTSQTDKAITFENVLVGDLKLSKTVSGTADLSREFVFTILLTDPEGNPVTDTFNAIFYQQDGTTANHQLAFGVDGSYTLSAFKHGETAVIQGIPIGTKWTIKESDYDGFTPTHTVTQGEVEISSGDENASGEIVSGETEVSYTNTVGYELPETGASGRGEKLLFCGVAMMAGAVMCVCLRKRYRGRRVTGG